MEKERAARQRAQRDKEIAARNDAAIQNTGKLLAKSAVNKAVDAREKEIEDETKMIHVVLALVVVMVAVLAGLVTVYIMDTGEDAASNYPFAVCTEVTSQSDLLLVLTNLPTSGSGSSTPPEKICSGLKLPETTCSPGVDKQKLTVKGVAKSFLKQQDSKACWETVVSFVCKDLGDAKLAEKVAEKYGVPKEVQYCQ